ncbi:MAG: hypothetical protein A2513_07555 [Sulfurimonas sp. RIFOXYD12_FULL_33_39]|uniref:hypothetical protein n=1 Tax=unclassified Sulfurimonas TaxID=2623549 RepID=UPI0008B54ED0|nr:MULTISPECIES: hypothetical protein [unclassified Sulfurimonas]OHE09141.1 MAG: hypothetical protein A2513_07555 [Sulfurimonas sp. RIFOXYD12_FULL_33_39]OHE14458.1 MAG: hypothetical protein A2530_10615 [Sulfurimonas sp. RIFOXYD2_FULL_34_21]DAB28627.1 MAG TPA: hypothetical protein CFH78_01410 [Sulfurimonas sp. UBA10385]
MKHISSIASGIALGSAGIAMMSVLSGCESKQQEQVQQNKFLIIEQQTNGKYVVVEEMPTDGPSRAIIREKDANGNVTERFMNEDEMKTLADQEYQKVKDGTSETLQSSEGSAGMGLAGTILAVAAGSLLGNMIGNALMNNKNFAQRSNTVNKSAYSRSSSASSSGSTSSTKKSFFGGSSGASSSSSTNYGG